jgi:diacylglycerol kinase (ATP)
LGHQTVDLTGSSASHTTAALERELAAGTVERVVAAGGDGLVNLAVQSLATTGVPLGLIPAGTGNDFAAALGLMDGPRGTAGAAEALGEATPVDLLRVESGDGVRWVASVAILGFPAAINARANRTRLPLGSARYTVAALTELPRYSRVVLDLRVDGVPTTSDSGMLAIGNTCYFGGGMLACPDALPDDGRAHLTSIEGVGRIGILAHLARKSGGSADRPEVRRLVATRYEIANEGLELWGDGEPLARTPLSVEVVPQALQVVR